MGKVKTQPGRNHNSLETFNEFSDAFGNTLKTEGKKTVNSVLNQLFNLDTADAPQEKNYGVKDPGTGERVIFDSLDGKAKNDNKKAYAEKAPKRETREAAIDYGTNIAKSSEKAMHHEMREVNQKLQEIMNEVQKLIASSKELKMEFAEVDVQQTPARAGEYHLNFYDWLLLTIRAARQKVEDSGAWLNVVKGKKNQKGYWGMFKKHGTSFGLSNERSLATQTG